MKKSCLENKGVTWTRLVQYCYYLAVLSLRDKSLLFKIWLMSFCCHFGSVFINILEHETPLHWVPYESICTRKSRNPGRKTIRKKKNNTRNGLMLFIQEANWRSPNDQGRIWCGTSWGIPVYFWCKLVHVPGASPTKTRFVWVKPTWRVSSEPILLAAP